MSEATRLLHEIAEGDREATARLLPLVYGELHRMARRSMTGQAADHTLQPTALVHEAYLRMFGPRSASWGGRRHFLGVAAKAMRSVLIDHARARQAEKRGEGLRPVPLDEAGHLLDDSHEVLALHRALTELAELDQRLAEVVELRFFGGLGVEDTAEVLAISPSSVKRDWRTAKAWLRRALDTEASA